MANPVYEALLARIADTFPDIVLEAAFDAPSVTGATTLHLDDDVSGPLGTGTLGAGQTWTDISPYCRGISVQRTADRVAGDVVTYGPGQLTTQLRNGDRRFDPLNLAGPYVVAGETQVEPMRGVRVFAQWGFFRYPLFTGYVDTWGVAYVEPHYSEATLEASDVFKVLAAYDRIERETGEKGEGETSGPRIARVIRDAVLDVDTDLDKGTVPLQGTVFAGNALQEIQAAAVADGGQLFVDGDGTVTMLGRIDAIVDNTRAFSQATFGDGGDDHPDELPYTDVAIVYDDSRLINIVNVAKAGDDNKTHVLRDEASISKYLPASYSSTDLPFLHDTSAVSWGERVLNSASKPELRMTQLVIRPGRDPHRLWPQVLGRRIGDRITVIRRPPSTVEPGGSNEPAPGDDPSILGSTLTMPFLIGVTAAPPVGAEGAVISAGPHIPFLIVDDSATTPTSALLGSTLSMPFTIGAAGSAGGGGEPGGGTGGGSGGSTDEAEPIIRECVIQGITHTAEPGTWETVWQLALAPGIGALRLDDTTSGLLNGNRLF